jgi:Carboxypeptidase regulatory-like domain
MRYLAASILWCVSASAQAPSPKPAEASTPTAKPDDKCSIEGTVVNAASGEPIKRARLTLAPIGQTNAIPYATTSDSTGHFLIDQVDAGSFLLTAFRSGYAVQSYSPNGDPKHNAALTLEKGQTLKDIVFKLTPQGVVSGRVLDEDGDPMADVTIECMRIGYEHGRRRLLSQDNTGTNDLGEFRMAGLTEGKYVIKATYNQSLGMFGRVVHERPLRTPRQGQAAEEGYITTYYPNTTNRNTASLIEVSAGSRIDGINITLMRARTMRIQGRVTGVPTNSRRIGLYLYPLESFVPIDIAVDAQTGFQIQGVVPGPYILRASFVAEDKLYTAWMPIEVRDSDIESIELVLQPPSELRGRLIIEQKGDLKGAVPTIWIQPKTDESGMGGGAAEVKDDLTFKIQNISLGSYDIHVGELPESFYLKGVRLGDQDVTGKGIDITQSVSGEELTVVLNPNGGVIEGSVANTKEEPAIGARVTLIPRGSHQSPTRYKTTDTDQNGHFIIKGVTPGEYKIYAWEDIEEGAYEDPDFMKPHESDGQAVSIKEGAHETVQLKAIPAESAASEKPTR